MKKTTTVKKVLSWGLIVIAALVFLYIFFVFRENISTEALSWVKVMTLLVPAPVISLVIAFWMPALDRKTIVKVFSIIGISFIFLLIWSYLLFGTGWSEIHGGVTSFGDFGDAIGYVIFFFFAQIIIAPLWAIAVTYLYLGGREIRRKRSDVMKILGIIGVVIGTIMLIVTAVLAAGIVGLFSEW